ncbi:MAG: hypothetical protein NTX50_10575 [Candidatus Sumerlaeota bacterium]|nr:hypothetical protein [Candidatus Sumerlaeota bacterium]
MRKFWFSNILILILAAGLIGIGDFLHACSVPVFRYALERWEAEPYEAFLFHRGPLSNKDKAAWDSLTSKSLDEQAPANVNCHAVDLAQPLSKELQEIWDNCSGSDLPWMVVLFPPSEARVPLVWKGRFDRKIAEGLLDSPKRQEIARHILAGDSAVWVMLESGDKARDEAVATTLSTELARLRKELKLPTDDDEDTATSDTAEKNAAAPGNAAAQEPAIEAPSIPLRIGFSLVRISRSDPAERMLVSMLTGSAPELAKKTGPVAFPVYGRGRVLGGIADDDITAEMIEEACCFLTDACSCFVKERRTGMDLLMSVNWDAVLQDALSVEKALPPLTGVTALLENKNQTRPTGLTGPTSPTDLRKPLSGAAKGRMGLGGLLMRNTILMVLFLGLLALAGAFRRRKRG